jgi:hypothetical protein
MYRQTKQTITKNERVGSNGIGRDWIVVVHD